jgi:cardiolipin-specific phospholipase
MSTLQPQQPSGVNTPPSRISTPPIPPPSKAIPTDFKSSFSSWWNNSSYKEARIAEERLLRRMSMYQPPEPGSPGSKGWFSWSADPNASTTKEHIPSKAEVGERAGEQVVNDENHAVPPVSLPGTSLVATLRNVFIPTPDPALAPQHPADPRIDTPASSVASSTTSLDSSGKKRASIVNPLHGKKGKDGKLTEYINTLEISNPEHGNSKEAVVVLHGYAAALGYVTLSSAYVPR